MIKILGIGLSALFVFSHAFAEEPVTLSGPVPAIPSTMNVGTSTTFIYTVTNHVPNQAFPLTVSGISIPVTRTSVAGDCGNVLQPGPSSCKIGITIAPTQAGTINQTLIVDYQGRTPLMSSISLSVAETLAYAYVTPALNATSIDKFLLGSTGLLTSYTVAHTASGLETFGQMTFATVSGVQYAYILDLNGAVYWCTINTNGSFSNCLSAASTPALGSWQARAIAFATFNAQYAYITDPGNNVVYQCSVETTGNFSNCQQPPSPYSLPTLAPYGITFATNRNGTQQAYIADAGSGGIGSFGYVLLCSMQSDGSFNTCNQTPSSGAPNWIPYAVAFTNVNGTQYAYVADNGTGTPGHVYKCTLKNDGSFVNSGCTQTPLNDSTLTNWYPAYIVFQTVNGTKYAYVVNTSGSSIGNIYRCALNNSGSLTNCALTPTTPPAPWQPVGIAFR